MCDRAVIGTSIAPFQIENQKECVLSWIRSGFKVCSYNCKSEIEILKANFEDTEVEFIEIGRSAVEYCGKELPFIQDILSGVAEQTEYVCGYFNSDIYFENVTESMYEFICEEAKDSVVVVHRNEINTTDDIKKMNWNINLDGIDGFFIGKSKAEGLYDDWAYVQTVWDTFLLIMCKKRGIPVKTLVNPIAFHKRHKVRWNYDRTQKTYEKVIENYYDGKENGRREIFYDKYGNLYHYSRNIVCCEREDYKVCFVLEEQEEKLIASIEKQKLPFYEVVIGDCDRTKKYDFIFKLKKGTVLDAAFSRFVFHLYETYGWSGLEVGRFFVSQIENRMIFNQLNKNITQLEYMNRQCDLYHYIETCNSEEKQTKKVLYPICYEMIDVMDETIVRREVLDGNTFIMPAGYRAGEWYSVNKCHLHTVDIIGCLDNDETKVGNTLAGLRIYSAKDVLKTKDKYNLILCTKYYQDEIREQIAHNDSVKLLDADSVLWVDETGIFYVFDVEEYKG